MTDEPHIGVRVFIVNDYRQLVIGCRRDDQGHQSWSVPGGSPANGEDFVQTAVRKALELTGLAVEVGHYLGEIHGEMATGEQWRTHFFKAYVTGGYMEDRLPEEFSHVRWVAFQHLRARKLFEPLETYLEMYGVARLEP